ncbi:unnamed protein product, partial [Medioppia subpectinata]
MNKAAIPIRMQIELSNPRFEIFGTVLDTDYKTYYLSYFCQTINSVKHEHIYLYGRGPNINALSPNTTDHFLH